MLEAVGSQVEAAPPEGVRFDDLRAGIDELAVDVSDRVRLRDVDDLHATVDIDDAALDEGGPHSAVRE